mgnify:CR=1 FL=1
MGDKRIDIMKVLDFLRGLVRPYISILFATVFAGLVIYGFIKYGDANMALTLMVAFIEAVGIIVGVYIGLRQANKK